MPGLPEEDHDLIARAARGDRTAFEALVRLHGGAMLRLARVITGDDARAEDAAQEALVGAFRGIGTFDATKGSARSWLLAIVRNAARKTHRPRTEDPLPDDASLMDLGAAAGWGAELDPESSAARGEDRERLARAIASLEATDREIILLRDVEQLDGEATARVLGIELTAMKSRLHRARLRLVAALRQSEGGIMASEREVGGIRCGAVLALLGDYVDGELAARDVERVERHLQGCTVCERFGGRFAGVVGQVRASLAAPPAVDERTLNEVLARLSD